MSKPQTKHRPSIKWGQLLGLDSCPYMRRWVIDMVLFSVRLHRFYTSDDERHFHDHPWWFFTIVLWGSYVDISPQGKDRLGTGSVRLRRAHHRHTVWIDWRSSGCLTFVITGPKCRVWGFWVKDRFLRAEKYFKRVGHHPCS